MTSSKQRRSPRANENHPRTCKEAGLTLTDTAIVSIPSWPKKKPGKPQLKNEQILNSSNQIRSKSKNWVITQLCSLGLSLYTHNHESLVLRASSLFWRAWVCSLFKHWLQTYLSNMQSRLQFGLGLFWIATRLPLKRIFEHPGGWSQAPSSFWWFHCCYRQNSWNLPLDSSGGRFSPPTVTICIRVRRYCYESSTKSKKSPNSRNTSKLNASVCHHRHPHSLDRDRAGSWYSALFSPVWPFCCFLVAYLGNIWRSLPSLSSTEHFAWQFCYIRIKNNESSCFVSSSSWTEWNITCANRWLPIGAGGLTGSGIGREHNRNSATYLRTHRLYSPLFLRNLASLLAFARFALSLTGLFLSKR